VNKRWKHVAVGTFASVSVVLLAASQANAAPNTFPLNGPIGGHWVETERGNVRTHDYSDGNWTTETYCDEAGICGRAWQELTWPYGEWFATAEDAKGWAIQPD
jgi:hypothetical protein